MTALLQVGRCHGLSLAEEAVGGGGKRACAVTRSGEPADGRETEPVGEKAPDRRSAELAETQARGADRKEERIGRVVRPVADQEGDDRRRGDAPSPTRTDDAANTLPCSPCTTSNEPI